DKIMIKIVFIMSLFFLSGCTSPNLVMIVNHTDKEIAFKGKFSIDSSEYQEMNFTLSPGDEDGWFYDPKFFSKEEVDSFLRAIVISNDKCSISLNREQIEQLFEGVGLWELTVTEELMNCP
ncbi:hypothetical protein L4C36_21545, partial [Photobacterium japonica]|uniref:hypothetical protein n=1 Tax=Photobacterium japonica TaxID=2910235 RepID=UPI003D0F29E5